MFAVVVAAGELVIARMLGENRIPQWAAKVVHFNAHSPTPAWSVAFPGVIQVQHIAFDHLQRKRHLALAERSPPDAPDRLTGFRQRARGHHLEAVEAQLAGNVTAISTAPLLPRLDDQLVAAIIKLAVSPKAVNTRSQSHTRSADDVDHRCALGLHRVGVVACELAGAIPQHAKAAAQFRVGRGRAGAQIEAEAVQAGRIKGAGLRIPPERFRFRPCGVVP